MNINDIKATQDLILLLIIHFKEAIGVCALSKEN